MPPKKRTTTSSTTSKAKKTKTAAAPVMTTKTSKTRMGTASTKADGSVTNQSSYNARRCVTWFKKYEDPDEEGVIGPEGVERLCQELGVELASIEILAVAWKLHAENMGFFKKNEWLDGMKQLNVDSMEGLKTHLDSFRRIHDSPQQFKDLYLFAFSFAKEGDQKSLGIDHGTQLLPRVRYDENRARAFGPQADPEPAKAMWQLLCPPAKFAHIDSFLQFLETKQPVKVINKDQWRSFLEFSNSVHGDLTGYDETSAYTLFLSALASHILDPSDGKEMLLLPGPVLLDEYVAWKKTVDAPPTPRR
ncbi:hypothetical protein PhCBS80983_g04633 [Powellomyces hirtus]|uniref:Defective in cullin neddylation protein n=1 Tax=Powellomyces hirtus TaxID=109895 RepID=A0A507DZR6_9FUNG|nr:hypothetical protein PhCBS80983_g04633 [Powellomyces hirtus]